MSNEMHFAGDAIRQIIYKAGEKLKKRYFESFTYSEKGRYDLVSEVDLEIDTYLIEQLRQLEPGASFYTEESGRIDNGRSDCRWIVDAVDGTANFIFGVPYFNISICLEDSGEIQKAYVYSPITDELFYSDSCSGRSYLNGMQINVSATGTVEEALVALGFSANWKNINRYYSEWKPLFENCRKGMGLLSPALNICNVARGRVDAFIDFGSSMEGHAAAALILKNAGGTVLNYELSAWDHKSKGIVALNGKLADIIMKFKGGEKDGG